jgi:hypothetical protein
MIRYFKESVNERHYIHYYASEKMVRKINFQLLEKVSIKKAAEFSGCGLLKIVSG